MPRRFAITFDYLCPFARNANEHVVAGLHGGADWDVQFVPFSLAQGHVEPEQQDVWDRDEPNKVPGVLALQAGLAVRDLDPERFPAVHAALFAARHDDGLDLKDPEVVRGALAGAGADPDAVFAQVQAGSPLDTLRAEHTSAVAEHEVWGVPTFIAGERAVFVRLMDRPNGSATAARKTIEHVVDLVEGAPMLHEFKQTDLPR